MTTEEQKRLDAIHHIVHEYANFVSSAEMVLNGKDIDGENFKPPINTHVSHAFYLNCRKLADFFQNRDKANTDNIIAEHYAPAYTAALTECDKWRDAINKQLAHLSYTRDISAKEIKQPTQQAFYDELKSAWRRFRSQLPKLYADRFVEKVKERKGPYHNGQLSEFRNYDLD